jgi:hypothetical protein
MNTHAAVLKKLAQLTSSDRRWILERLSNSSKTALLGDGSQLPPSVKGAAANSTRWQSQGQASVANESKSFGNDEIAHHSVRTKLMRASAATMKSLLHNESAWVLHVILTAENWPWSAEVLSLLSPQLRASVSQLGNSGVLYSIHLTNSLLDALSHLIGNQPTVPHNSRFDNIVSRFSARLSRKRLSISI